MQIAAFSPLILSIKTGASIILGKIWSVSLLCQVEREYQHRLAPLGPRKSCAPEFQRRMGIPHGLFK
mgnify:CR=1 FL=1